MLCYNITVIFGNTIGMKKINDLASGHNFVKNECNCKSLNPLKSNVNNEVFVLRQFVNTFFSNHAARFTFFTI